MKVGLIAGSGDLPGSVVAATLQAEHEIFIAFLDGFSAPQDCQLEHGVFGLAEFGKMVSSFHKAGCTHVCFAGNVQRPDFRKLKPDLKGLRHLPGAVKAAAQGDDSLLAYLLAIFEAEGFGIVSPQALCSHLLIPAGNLGRAVLTESHKKDAEKACITASAIGALDIGQAAIVCRGLILAVEAQEGTDEMLKRTARLPSDIRGNSSSPEGVLAKMVKPGQEERIDLPTIGPETIRLAAEAGLAGIVAESGRAFVLERETVIAMADEAGFFIHGILPEKL